MSVRNNDKEQSNLQKEDAEKKQQQEENSNSQDNTSRIAGGRSQNVESIEDIQEDLEEKDKTKNEES